MAAGIVSIDLYANQLVLAMQGYQVAAAGRMLAPCRDSAGPCC